MVLISVVIPTLRRPKLAKRAVKSVLLQTYANIELIVVVDGPDPETAAMLASIEDPRLQVILNVRSLTAAGARNAGIERATGAWIAFLDDDDEWLPEKLAKQIAFAAERDDVVVSCLSRIVTPDSSVVQPAIAYDNKIPLEDYLFDRSSPSAPFGFIQTSSYLISRVLLAKTRFRVGTPHDDWDFILRIANRPHIRVETVPEVLTIVFVDDSRPSLSKSGTWLDSLAWIDSMRSTISPRAYSGFCLTVAGPRAASQRDYKAFFLLLHRAFKYGSPRYWRVVAFASLWVVPRGLLRAIRAVF